MPCGPAALNAISNASCTFTAPARLAARGWSAFVKIVFEGKVSGGIVEITDQTGKLLASLKVKKGENEIEFPTQNLKNGVYFVGFSEAGKTYEAMRFMVRK